MPITTMQDFVAEFIEVQDGIMRDYPELRGVCHVMHRDIGLGATKREDAEEAAERAAEVLGIESDEVDADALDFTVEHNELHGFLRQLMLEATIAGADPSQLLATMFVVGRRMGMREAVRMLDTNPPAGGEFGPTSQEFHEDNDGPQAA